jgi:hypothetical protein
LASSKETCHWNQSNGGIWQQKRNEVPWMKETNGLDELSFPLMKETNGIKMEQLMETRGFNDILVLSFLNITYFPSSSDTMF